MIIIFPDNATRLRKDSAEVKAKALAAGIDGDPTVFVDGNYESGVTSDGG